MNALVMGRILNRLELVAEPRRARGFSVRVECGLILPDLKHDKAIGSAHFLSNADARVAGFLGGRIPVLLQQRDALLHRSRSDLDISRNMDRTCGCGLG